MKRNKRPGTGKRQAKNNRLTIVLCCIVFVLLLAIVAMLIAIPKMAATNVVETTSPTTAVSTEATTEPTEEETTVPTEPEPKTILPELAEKYAENPDLAGWITIEGTPVDYPVMYNAEDGEKYLRADFSGNVNIAGLPFIKAACSLDPESDNLLIYGHNMHNGTMFNSLVRYQNKEYWEEHPTITFKTLYEERTYEVVSAFYDRVYKKTDTNFKFYQFIDARDEEHFNEAIAWYDEHEIYDTGVVAEYGDHLITLITCAYHVANGRFVVVARQVVDEPVVETTAETIAP